MNGESAGQKKQNIFLYDRQRAHLEGIEEVESFSDTEIVALSSLGRIYVEGEQLKIDSFSTESGELVLNGSIDSLYYDTSAGGRERKKGRLGRFFG